MIDKAESITHLARLLNDAESLVGINLDNLPVFSEHEPVESPDAYSWDENSVLLLDDSGQWAVELRCPCGQSQAYCVCD